LYTQCSTKKISLRKIRKPIDAKKFQEFYETIKDHPYESNVGDLIKAAIDIPGVSAFENVKEDLTEIFCSELVGAALKHLKLIPETFISSEYTPEDFSVHSHKQEISEVYCDEDIEIKLPF